MRAEAGWRMVHREEPPLAGEYNLSLSPSATTREQWEKHHKQQLVSVKVKKLKVYGILNHNYLPLGAHKTDQEVYDNIFLTFSPHQTFFILDCFMIAHNYKFTIMQTIFFFF